MKRVLVAILVCICAIPVFSQGYNIALEIDGLQDSTMLLAVYSGDKQFAVDSAVLDKGGRAVFSGEEPLYAGMYLVIMGKSILFDLLISDEDSQHFTINLDGRLLSTPKFENSPENAAFYRYHTFKNDITRKQQEVNQQLMNASDSGKLDSLNVEAGLLRKSLAHYSDSVADSYRGKTIELVLNALNVPEPPEVDVPRDDPQRDSLIYMNYYSFAKNHFFDRINLADDRLARTPFFESMLLYYFDNLLLFQQADSIIPYVDKVIARTADSKFMYRYVLSNLFNHYMQSKIMGQEGVVVHLAEKYYMDTEKAGWESEKFMTNITNFVNRTKPTLLGSTAPDLFMETLAGQPLSMSNINAPFLVLYFYEPSCGYCKKETPAVHRIYEKYKDRGVQVLAVYTQQDKDGWSAYVSQHGLDWINVWDAEDRNDYREKYNVYVTPQLYLLDKDKKVLGRRLDSETLGKMLEHLTKSR